MSGSPDIVIIGSGMGEATIAAGFAGSGASILILERGQSIADTPETRDPRAIFLRGHYYQVGTCKMGADALAVVGPGLKVHGLEGLRVCDSSTMPTLVPSHTHGPTIMIGQGAADLVRGVAADARHGQYSGPVPRRKAGRLAYGESHEAFRAQ